MFYYFRKIALFKTLHFNYKYFGIKGLYMPVWISKNVKFDSLNGSVEIDSFTKGNIKLGFSEIGIIDSKYSRFLWQNSGKIYFGKNINMGIGCKISNSGCIEFGKNFSASGNMSIVCKKHIKFGKDDLIAWDTLFMDSDLHSIYDFDNNLDNQDKDILVGDHVWIGCRNTILKGGKLSSGSIVSAGSIINKNIEENNVIIGN